MVDRAVRDDIERRDATRPDPGLRVRRFGPWVGIGLVGSILRPGTASPPRHSAETAETARGADEPEAEAARA